MELSQECPVCFEIYSTRSKPLISACGHSFCESCLKLFVVGNCLCPVCQTPMSRDLSKYIVNYGLIPDNSSQKQAKKPNNPNYDLLKARLQQEIKYHEEINRTLDIILNDFTESSKNAEFEIETCIKSLINVLENTKTSLLNELLKVKAYNEQKVIAKKREIDNLIKIRKNIMINLLESSQKSTELSSAIQLEISSLEAVKSHEIDLKRSEFTLKTNNINQDFISVIVKNLKFNDEKSVFEYQSTPETMPAKPADSHLNNKEQFRKNERNPREQANYNETRDTRTDRDQQGYGRGRNDKRDRDQRRGNRNEYNQGEPRNAQGNHFRHDQRAQQKKEEIKEQIDFSDPNINLVWYIRDRNTDILLPDFAIGQIERCRLKSMKKIRIFREGSAAFLADLIAMQYFNLDINGNIVPGQSDALFCRRS